MDSLLRLDSEITFGADWRAKNIYNAGNALGWLTRSYKQASVSQALSGRLYLAKSGWLLLSVPNALVRGLFDALTAPGAELPTGAVWGHDSDVLNAHISVMSAEEVKKIGADKINERGHHFGYSLGQLKEITPKTEHLSRVWAVQVSAPALSALRKSYGLSALLNNDHQFHITVAIRRKNVLRDNNVSRFDVASGRGELKAAAAEFGDIAQPGERGVCNAEVVGSSPSISTKQAGDPFVPTKGVIDAPEKSRSLDQVESAVSQNSEELAADHVPQVPGPKEKLPVGNSDILAQLLAAKAHSDNRRYDHKAQILRELMHKSPNDWVIDDAGPKYPGITHRPTNFRFHSRRQDIPVAVKAGSVYLDQLKSAPFSGPPIVYDQSKPVYANIRNHLQLLKSRGDRVLQTQRNDQTYRAAADPKYRHELALQAFRGEMPQPGYVDQLIERYGDNVLNAGV